MAKRVRKLARELKRTPAHVLGLLHAVGYVRYRSPEDMLPDAAIERVREADRDGVVPVPVPVDAPAKASPSAAQTSPGGRSQPDLMSQLVPGIKPVGGPAIAPAPTPVQRPPVTIEQAPGAAVAPAKRPDPALEQRARELEERAARLEAERAELVSERSALEAERTELAAERERLTSWAAELDARQRAVDEAAAAELAEAQAAEIERLTARAGELLLLSGLRRMVIAGGAPGDLKALRDGIDRRIEMRFVAGDRGRVEAESDVSRTDVLVLFGVAADADARAVYDGSPVTVVDAGAAGSAAEVCARIIEALEADIA